LDGSSKFNIWPPGKNDNLSAVRVHVCRFLFEEKQDSEKAGNAAIRQEPEFLTRRTGMNQLLLKAYVKASALLGNDGGQDLVEYALLLTLITLALISGIQGIASTVNTTFSNISASLS
jgi:Flp pilus assembly pilin Flp